jgi:hypothetical protein
MGEYLTIRRLLFVGILIGLSLVNSPAAAQNNAPPAVRPSQHGQVSQRIADTWVTVDYRRPVARGRELFGELVRWGRIWTPSADSAVVITFSTDVRVNGQALPAGEYSIWTIPQPEEWTYIFNRVAPVFHTRYPEGQDALRLTVSPREGAHMETLAYYFPVVDGKRAELVLHWGTVVVPLQIEVP